MEQDIVNNLKSRVQKLEEELLKVVSARNSYLSFCSMEILFLNFVQSKKFVLVCLSLIVVFVCFTVGDSFFM